METFLIGRTPHQKTHPGKKRPNCVFCVFFGNKKDARRPYDHFGGGIAPRSLLCVRKRRFPFSVSRTILCPEPKIAFRVDETLVWHTPHNPPDPADPPDPPD